MSSRGSPTAMQVTILSTASSSRSPLNLGSEGSFSKKSENTYSVARWAMAMAAAPAGPGTAGVGRAAQRLHSVTSRARGFRFPFVGSPFASTSHQPLCRGAPSTGDARQRGFQSWAPGHTSLALALLRRAGRAPEPGLPRPQPRPRTCPFSVPASHAPAVAPHRPRTRALPVLCPSLTRPRARKPTSSQSASWSPLRNCLQAGPGASSERRGAGYPGARSFRAAGTRGGMGAAASFGAGSRPTKGIYPSRYLGELSRLPYSSSPLPGSRDF